jgi:small subunit ribosomal protein S4
MFDKASRSKGKTGDVLLQLCESRLDNVVFRLGLGKTRDAARQLVGHRHITLNGEIASIPSINVKPGDVIGVREKSKSLVVIGDSLASKSADHPWIEWNESKMEGTFLSVPSRDAIPENIKEQLIVELYSK